MSETDEDDELDRRLGYVLTGLNIAYVVVGIVGTIVLIDKMTGGSLQREWERRLDTFKQARKAAKEYALQVRRMHFEAWRTLQEANDE